MIYEPAEDSFLLEKVVRDRAKGKRVLDIGTGSGILALAALRVEAEEVLAVDINAEAVKSVKQKGVNAVKSDLFSKVSGRFDLIIFNPPYLPFDRREDKESTLITSGGEKGDEIILRFIENAKEHLDARGEILLLVSSLTPMRRINQVLRDGGFRKKVVARQKVFMEELKVLEIRKT